MGMTLSQPIADARTLLNDAAATRYSAADMLRYANDCLREMAQKYAPQFFIAEGEFVCTANKALQTIDFDDALALVEVLNVKNGDMVGKVSDRSALDDFSPGWMVAAAAAAEDWVPVPTDPRRFYVNPPAPSGQVLVVLYVQNPTEYATGDDTNLPASLRPAVAEYIAGRCQIRDEEYANGGTNAFLDAFKARFA